MPENENIEFTKAETIASGKLSVGDNSTIKMEDFVKTFAETELSDWRDPLASYASLTESLGKSLQQKFIERCHSVLKENSVQVISEIELKLLHNRTLWARIKAPQTEIYVKVTSGDHLRLIK